MLEFMLIEDEYIPVFRCCHCKERFYDPKLAYAMMGEDTEDGKQMLLIHKLECSKNYAQTRMEFDGVLLRAMLECGFEIPKTLKKDMKI